MKAIYLFNITKKTYENNETLEKFKLCSLNIDCL